MDKKKKKKRILIITLSIIVFIILSIFLKFFIHTNFSGGIYVIDKIENKEYNFNEDLDNDGRIDDIKVEEVKTYYVQDPWDLSVYEDAGPYSTSDIKIYINNELLYEESLVGVISIDIVELDEENKKVITISLDRMVWPFGTILKKTYQYNGEIIKKSNEFILEDGNWVINSGTNKVT